MYYIDVILPIPLRQAFTYQVNKDEARFLKQGMRVAVPFGKSKVYTGLVFKVHRQPPAAYETKEIHQILDEEPLVTQQQWQHWQWMADYYMCTLGEVIRAALPSALLLESETLVRRTAVPLADENALDDESFTLMEALDQQPTLHINDVRSILDKKRVIGVIKGLIEKGLVELEEQVVEKYKPKMVRYVRMHPRYRDDSELSKLLDRLDRAPKQKEMLLTFYTMSAQSGKPISSTALQKRSGASAAILRALLDKEVLEEYFLQQDRVSVKVGETSKLSTLSTYQETALKAIKSSFEKQPVCLFHGVTSSGKTEIYVRLIREVLEQGGQVLYMLPEIALTAQLISRLRNYFGNAVAVYHSKYTLSERVEVWNNVLAAKPNARVVLGARSSLFLPFRNLGLVIVDEAHESSFKQFNPSPRYHGRDAAIVLAKQFDAKVLLGSATPSLESTFNAREEKYGYVCLDRRFGEVLPPVIELVDLKENYRKKRMKGHFSERLLEAMQEAFADDQQVILFQNRRGFAPVVSCTSCGTVPQCPNCDVSLTYHKAKDQLRCHYCGYRIPTPQSCVACGMETLDYKGLGTEQVAAEVQELFPDKKVRRMDQDSMRRKHAYEKLIEAVDTMEVDVVVGTQMVAKGLDFRNIGLVGVMNADNLLNFPDFRAHERSFQLLQQVAGRSGRTDRRGRVLIQTYNPHHRILQQVTTNDYDGMYTDEMEQRYQFKYPPYHRLLQLKLQDRNYQRMQQAANWLAKLLRTKLDQRVLGPESPPVGRIRNQFITHILVKIDRKESLGAVKDYILRCVKSFNAVKEFASVKLTVDVDNY